MRYLNRKKSLRNKVESLEKEVDKLQEVVESLLEELGYKVGTTIYESDWNSYEVFKANEKKKRN